MVEGSIIGYESNSNLAGLGQDILASVPTRNTSRSDCREPARRQCEYRRDPFSVNTSKTILSYEVQAGVFRFLTTSACLKGKWVTPRTNLLCVPDVGYRNRGHFPD